MICPLCRTEYREGYLVCVDCGVGLVPELPAAPPAEAKYGRAEDYVPLLNVNSRLAYDMLRAHLDAVGISYYPPPELIDTLGFPFSLKIRKDQAEESSELLQDLLAGEEEPANTPKAQAVFEEQAGEAADVFHDTVAPLSLEEAFSPAPAPHWPGAAPTTPKAAAAQSMPSTAAAPAPYMPAVAAAGSMPIEEAPAQVNNASVFSVVAEVMVVRDGRYLSLGTAGAAIALPSCALAYGRAEEEGGLEGALRRYLRDDHGLEIGDELIYLGNRLCPQTLGPPALRVLFLARDFSTETEDSGERWLFAVDMARLPGISPALATLIRYGDQLRIAKGW